MRQAVWRRPSSQRARSASASLVCVQKGSHLPRRTRSRATTPADQARPSRNRQIERAHNRGAGCRSRNSAPAITERQRDWRARGLVRRTKTPPRQRKWAAARKDIRTSHSSQPLRVGMTAAPAPPQACCVQMAFSHEGLSCSSPPAAGPRRCQAG